MSTGSRRFCSAQCLHFLLIFVAGVVVMGIIFNQGRYSGRKDSLKQRYHEVTEHYTEHQEYVSLLNQILTRLKDIQIVQKSEKTDTTNINEASTDQDQKSTYTVNDNHNVAQKPSEDETENSGENISDLESKHDEKAKEKNKVIENDSKNTNTLGQSTTNAGQSTKAEEAKVTNSETKKPLEFTTSVSPAIKELSPNEIIDLDKEYPGGPPDVTWPTGVKIKLPTFDKDKPVPNILHYAWYGGSKRGNLIKEHHYISLMSGYKRLKPRRIIFWYDERPTGPLWEKFRRTAKNILQMVERAPPKEIFGNVIVVPEHHSDIVRLEAVMYYGGVYTDLDVIILKDFAPLYKYNTSMGYEVDYGLCNGIIVSKPAAPFLTLWYGKYKTFNDKEWSKHSVILPATLAKQNPSLIHTEATSMHKPYWGELNKIYGNKSFDWSNNYAIHLWFRLHGKEHTIEELKTMNNTYGQISRYTLFDSPKIIPS